MFFFAIERLFIYDLLMYLPRSKHSCLCCRWPVSFQTEPRPHTWPRSHDLLALSGTGNTWRTCQSDKMLTRSLPETMLMQKQTSKSSFVFFQMHVVASKLADARYFPQGDQATFLTVRWCASARTLLHSQLSPENKDQTHNSQTILIK